MLCNLAMKCIFWWANDPALHTEKRLRQVNVKAGWWRVVEVMAHLVAEGCHEADLTEMGVRQTLRARGFPEKDILEACAWIERTTASGTLQETWAMLQPHSVQFRISNPAESVFFSQKLWERLEVARLRALIPPDLFEKLLEGVRVLDPREWDDDDIINVMAEMVQAVIPQMSAQTFRSLLERDYPFPLC